MVWLEFNVHIRNRALEPSDLFDDSVEILLDLVKPLVNNERTLFTHWHYLLEPDVCRGEGCYEIRLRFESSQKNIGQIKNALTSELDTYVNRTYRAMRENEPLGSHEGCHGHRGVTYLGERSENFGKDWNTIVEILEKGSENALSIFTLGRTLVEDRSLQLRPRQTTIHPHYTHFPANQLVVE